MRKTKARQREEKVGSFQRPHNTPEKTHLRHYGKKQQKDPSSTEKEVDGTIRRSQQEAGEGTVARLCRKINGVS